MLEPNSLFELLDCSETGCYCPGLSLVRTLDNQDQTPLLKHLATLSETKLAIQPETNPYQTWRIGSTRWAGGHLRQKLAIDGASLQIGFPPRQVSSYHHRKSQNNSLETQNWLEATSHQKLATDGASFKMVPTHTI